MYAVIETAGKQYRVSVGSVIRVDSVSAEIGTVVTLDKVLLLSSDGKVQVGSPHVATAKVIAEVREQGMGPKLRVIKKKRRKNYRRVIGSRKGYTALEIKEVLNG